MSRRFSHRGFLALALLAIPACGGQEGYRFDVHPADGTVTYKDKPVANAIVRFHPTDPAAVKIPDGQTGPEVMLTTETDTDGKFAMSTYLADDGVPAGDYSVTVLMNPNETDLENSDGDYKKAPASASGVNSDIENDEDRPARSRRKPGKKSDPTEIYRQASTTPLKATVKPGEANHFVFEMK